jgi:putative MATE family efflux protein
MITDLTVGSPAKLLLRFSLPLMISMLFQQTYTIADSVIAGQLISMDALAAIGASYPVTMIYMAFAGGCNIGCSVVISQLFGAKDYTRMKTAVFTSLTGVTAIALLLTIIGVATCEPLLLLLNTPENIMGDSALYLNIYLLGLPFLFLYNICNGICTALGDSKTPLYFLVSSSIGNILLSLAFVGLCGWGLAGAAWATFACQAICSGLALWSLLYRLHGIITPHRPKIFSFRMLGRIGAIAVPSIFQQSFVSVGNLMVQGLINSFGAATIAGFSSAMRVNTFALAAVGTFGNGVSSFTAQNIGAGKIDRVKKGFRGGVIMSEILTAVFMAVMLLCAPFLIGLFLESGESGADTAQALEAGTRFLYIVVPGYCIVSMKFCGDGVLRGNGSMLFFMIATFSDLVIRVVLSYILVPFIGPMGICLSWPMGWIPGTVLSLIFSRVAVKRLSKRYFLRAEGGG